MPQDLFNCLCKIINIYDFSKIILNKEIVTLNVGTQFGELALNSNEMRQASIKAKEVCILAYLEREDYQKALRTANLRDAQKQMQFLKENRFLEDISTAKLQKLAYNMKRKTFVKN